MKVMLLAAGFGKRMLPLTEKTPKPLLRVGDDTLIGHQLRRIKAAGFNDVVINVAYLGEQIVEALGDGSQYGLSIAFSKEEEPLETAGGIDNALELLGNDPFVLVNGDVWCDFPLSQWRSFSLDNDLGCLVMVDNPNHNHGGDFQIVEGYVRPCDVDRHQSTYTYSGLALLTPQLLFDYPRRRSAYPLKEVFDWAIAQNRLRGVVHQGDWVDVGTPERLQQLNSQLS
ncbi:N-acetylmuramate alpha-1-phosphate uridylyltransferase MurU [Sessilibacter corallicola]|uniref:N-acetylmuramate alpha-1-phosphate uridylyltransferase MurU n=1 Tax=Sessilibacter corallicola TaxID=2904075 RepID=UPI001E5CBD4C|nr:nucleotidyltransferase family protein [Sessilibacter corallicola]